MTEVRPVAACHECQVHGSLGKPAKCAHPGKKASQFLGDDTC